jgi:sporulation protein YlmC with PRC-barrel domain
MRLSDESIRGRTVIASDGVALGVIGLLFIDANGWRVESLQVKLHKDVADRLGAGRTLFRSGTVEIPVAMVQSVGDAVVLTVKVDELRQVLAPTAEVTPSPPPPR